MHKRKKRDWAENDYYDSDEDTFLDRTGLSKCQSCDHDASLHVVWLSMSGLFVLPEFHLCL